MMIPVGTNTVGLPILLSNIAQIEAHVRKLPTPRQQYDEFIRISLIMHNMMEDFGATGSALLYLIEQSRIPQLVGVTDEVFRADFEELIEMTHVVKASRDQTKDAIKALFKLVGSKTRGRALVNDLLKLKYSEKVFRLVAKIAKRSASISEAVHSLNNAIIDNLREEHPQGSRVSKNISPREAEKASKVADSFELFLSKPLSVKEIAELGIRYTLCGLLSHHGPLHKFVPFKDDAKGNGLTRDGEWLEKVQCDDYYDIALKNQAVKLAEEQGPAPKAAGARGEVSVGVGIGLDGEEISGVVVEEMMRHLAGVGELSSDVEMNFGGGGKGLMGQRLETGASKDFEQAGAEMEANEDIGKKDEELVEKATKKRRKIETTETYRFGMKVVVDLDEEDLSTQLTRDLRGFQAIMAIAKQSKSPWRAVLIAPRTKNLFVQTEKVKKVLREKKHASLGSRQRIMDIHRKDALANPLVVLLRPSAYPPNG
ncbi:uncharacterized protein PAC_00587 [Phialocephala subalpina]|uniref:Uncharacterized protein n=1 Tax=Phialocephala subalpina TaxID=576137 RepID=A0A1L7WD46_9HELO|nr:uncharacterized protein PAC_00587 [Phialocephala subalpina]